MLLAIADDAAGLAILAAFYPQEAVHPLWFLLTAGSVGLGLLLRAWGVRSFWWYLLGPGVLCWWSFHEAGIHPALGLVPIIPTMPHSRGDRGLFAHSDPVRRSTLDNFGHWWSRPTELILGLFGLTNAGVPLGNVGTGTWLVLAGLLVGKPLGIILFAALGEGLFGLKLPEGMKYRDVLVMGVVAGIGFTVALFVASAAFPEPGPIQDAAKMGAWAASSRRPWHCCWPDCSACGPVRGPLRIRKRNWLPPPHPEAPPRVARRPATDAIRVSDTGTLALSSFLAFKNPRGQWKLQILQGSCDDRSKEGEVFTGPSGALAARCTRTLTIGA